jgi:hypothetical protein
MSQASASRSAAGYQDAWAGREPASDDESYRVGYEEGLIDSKRAAARPIVNPVASRAATGRARRRSQGNNDQIFAKGQSG